MSGPTYIGELEGAVLASRRILTTPRTHLYLHPQLGLVSARTQHDAQAGRWLKLHLKSAKRCREILYFRDRQHLGYPLTNWYHETNATLIDPTGAVSSPTAHLCNLKGDFICGG